VWLTALVAGMASYIDSAAITAFATSLIVFQNRLGLLPQQLGLAGGTLAACMAIGAAVGGRLGDRFGRRPVFVVTMLAIIAGALLLVWGRSFEMVLIGTAIVGAAVGADLPVSLATIAETADDSNRGRMLAGSNVLWLCGIIGNGVLAAVFGGIGDTLPVILFGHIIVVSMVVTCGRLFVPESRVWLAARANRAGGSGASAKPVSWLELFRPPFRAPFLGLCLFYGLTNILANTYSQYMSYILVKFAGFSISSAATLLTSSLPLSLLGYLWFAKVADQRNRLTYFKFGAVCFVSAPLVIAIFGLSTPTVIAMLLLKAGGISFAFEGIYRIWAQQAFSTLLRTTAQGTILAFVRALAALSAFVAPSLIASIGVRGLFATMAVTTAAGVLIGWAVFRHRDQESVFGRE
jgi:inositol transporter-like SP family MFS transporter